MKKVFLLIIGICSVFISCSKEDSLKEPTFVKDELFQTTWKGHQEIYHTDGHIYTEDFFIEFQREPTAYYVTTGREYNERRYFQYRLEGKMLYADGQIPGNWTLIEKTKNRLTLEGFVPEKSTLVLERVH